MATLFILFETAAGYCLFKKEEYDETGGQLSKVQKAVNDLERFKKMVTFEAQYSFKTAEEALENMQAIAHNKCSPAHKAFLKSNLASSSSSKKQKFSLGIMDPRLGPQIHEEAGITASFNDTIVELLRGIRTHYPKLLKSKKHPYLTLPFPQRSTIRTWFARSWVSVTPTPATAVPRTSTARTSLSSRRSH